VWLSIPRDPQGRLVLDKKNPEPALRQRPLCGLTIFWGLQPGGPDRWTDGWFYNLDNGETYNISGELKSADTIEARIYLGDPIQGQTKMLYRVPHAHRMDGAEEGRRAVCKFTKVRMTRVLSRGTSDARYFRDQWT
jgi:hypothetical protein